MVPTSVKGPKSCAKCGVESPWVNGRNLRRYHGWTVKTVNPHANKKHSGFFLEELWLCKRCSPKDSDADR